MSYQQKLPKFVHGYQQGAYNKDQIEEFEKEWWDHLPGKVEKGQETIDECWDFLGFDDLMEYRLYTDEGADVEEILKTREPPSLLTETQQRTLKKFENDANFWIENRYNNRVINEDLIYSIKMALSRLIQSYENVGSFLRGTSKRLSFDVSRQEVNDINFDSRFDIPCECTLNVTLCIDGVLGYDEEKLSEIISKHVEPIHCSELDWSFIYTPYIPLQISSVPLFASCAIDHTKPSEYIEVEFAIDNRNLEFIDSFYDRYSYPDDK